MCDNTTIAMESRQRITSEGPEERAALPDDFAGMEDIAAEEPVLAGLPALPPEEVPVSVEPASPPPPPATPPTPAISREERLMEAVTQLQQAVQVIFTELRLPDDHPARRHLTAAREQVDLAWADTGMVVIPAGEFTMGSAPDDADAPQSEKPARTVYLDAYAIDRLPVTVEQYLRFCRETHHPVPPEPVWGWHDDHPVVNVSWFDAVRYAAWAGKRLPTEAEWEKAARGTDGRTYPWGDAWEPARCQCPARASAPAGTAPAGQLPDGAGPYGVLDMAGNVWEWCADWFDPYYYLWAPRENPAGPETGASRVLRGGSWRCAIPGYLRCAFRNFNRGPATWYNDRGFRCAKTL